MNTTAAVRFYVDKIVADPKISGQVGHIGAIQSIGSSVGVTLEVKVVQSLKFAMLKILYVLRIYFSLQCRLFESEASLKRYRLRQTSSHFFHRSGLDSRFWRPPRV